MIPKLQGPFEFDLNPEDEQDDEVELKDIYVIGEKANTADLMTGEDEELEVDEENETGLSLTVICLLSTSGQVKICLDVDGVEAQWLPARSKRSSRLFSSAPQTPSLLTFQTFDTLKPVEVTPESWPMFSGDVTSRYAFYITHPAGITYVSLAPWVFRLESELQGESDAGAEFRIDLLAKGQGSERERIYTQARGQNALAAATAIRDPDLGYFVLSATHQDPVVLFFDTPESQVVPRESPVTIPEPIDLAPQEIGWEARPLFHPSDALNHRSALPTWIDHLKTGRRRPLYQQELRLSMATLEVFHEGHKLVSNEVSEINDAVAELFRKCESLQEELRSQIKAANEAKTRIDRITGEDSPDDDPPVSHNDIIVDRLQRARDKHEELAARMEKLKRQLSRATSRDLSDKERAWADEVRTLSGGILGPETDDASPSSTPKTHKQPWKRFEEVQSLRDALFSQAEALQKSRLDTDSGDSSPASPALPPSLRIPAGVRKQKMAQVIGLLDRETALVDAVKARIEKLSVG